MARGPSSGVTRELGSNEADPFDDDAGSVPAAQRRRESLGVYCENPGGKNVKTVPDARVLQNKADKAARAKAAPPYQAPKHVEDWEQDAPVPLRAPPKAVQPQQGDPLQRARVTALNAFGALPEGVVIKIGQGLGVEGVEFVLGMGVLMGEGLVAYRGDGAYSITDAGRRATITEG